MIKKTEDIARYLYREVEHDINNHLDGYEVMKRMKECLKEYADNIVDRCAEMTIHPNKNRVLEIKKQIQ